MSAPEITQCVVDIKNWFLRTKCAKYIGNSGSAIADLQRHINFNLYYFLFLQY